MSNYGAMYEKQFVRNLDRYMSLRQNIRRRVERILADPYMNTELLADAGGKLNLLGCRSARVSRRTALDYNRLYCQKTGIIGGYRMDKNLTFKYDRQGDILYINTCQAYPEQESEEIGDEVVARLNPKTGEIENIEVLFFSTRLLRTEFFDLPITARFDYRSPTINRAA